MSWEEEEGKGEDVPDVEVSANMHDKRSIGLLDREEKVVHPPSTAASDQLQLPPSSRELTYQSYSTPLPPHTPTR